MYASGNSEWGRANPTKSVARRRVDNFGAGFLRADARAVFAEGITSASYILYGLFRTNRSMGSIFMSSSKAVGDYDFQFASTGPWISRLDGPYAPSRYYAGDQQPRPDGRTGTWRLVPDAQRGPGRERIAPAGADRFDSGSALGRFGS